MKFPELLLEAIGRSEIPLRFEPGAEEAVAAPVTELIRAWLESHRAEFDDGRTALIQELLEELDGSRETPAQSLL
jgi:hypothetical protein